MPSTLVASIFDSSQRQTTFHFQALCALPSQLYRHPQRLVAFRDLFGEPLKNSIVARLLIPAIALKRPEPFRWIFAPSFLRILPS
jgi:hypothetical protein